MKYKEIFIDGTKIEANANRYTFVWAKAVEKNSSKLKERMAGELSKYALKYDMKEDASLDEIISCLSDYVQKSEIEFVSVKGRHKIELQRDTEKLVEYRERMKEDHMQNGQLKPGYNVWLQCSDRCGKWTAIITWQNELLNHKDKSDKSFSPVYLKTVHNQLSAIFHHAVM